MITIPPGSAFQTIIESYFGDSPIQSATAENKLWSNFLTANGLDPDDPDVQTLIASEDPTLLTKFVQFAKQTYETMQTNKLSPDEVARRQLVFSVYDLIVLLLQIFQQTVGVLGKNVVFLGDYQRQFTDMAARIGQNIYIAGQDSIPHMNPDDLSSWTLGYGNITMQEYLTTAIVGAGGTDIRGQSFSPLNIPLLSLQYPPPDPNLKREGTAIVQDFLTEQSIGPISIEDLYDGSSAGSLQIFADSTSVGFTYNYPLLRPADAQNGHPNPYFTPLVINSPAIPYSDPNESFDEKLKEVSAGFQAFLNQSIQGTSLTVGSSMTTPTTLPFGGGGFQFTQVLARRWDNQYNMMYTPTGDSGDHATQSSAADRRANKNSLLQQYVQNAQMQRQIQGNQADAENSQLQQAQTGISQGSNILSTAIQQMSTILTSIFQIAT